MTTASPPAGSAVPGSATAGPGAAKRRSGARSIGLVAICLVLAGVIVNGYLLVVARSLGTAGYAHFGAIWSITLIVQFGFFLPVEQELTRLLHTVRAPGDAVRNAVRGAGLLLAAALVIGAALGPVLFTATGRDGEVLVALAALAVISAGQFVLRGIFIGLGRMDVHGGVLLLDAFLRTLIALALGASAASTSVPAFAWGLAAAIGVAHLTATPWAVRALSRRTSRPEPEAAAAGSDSAGTDTGATDAEASRRVILTALAHLALAALLAQVVLNALPVLLAATNHGQESAVGTFTAAFTLLRAPLFIAVPLQTAILPTMIAQVGTGRRAQFRRFLLRLAMAIVGLAVVAGLGAYLLGPAIVRLLLGRQYSIGAGSLAVMAVGVIAYLGTLLLTQALLSLARHRAIAGTWLIAALAGGLVFALVPGVLDRAQWGFLTAAVTSFGAALTAFLASSDGSRTGVGAAR